ncbi:hypothetical protein [Chryseobacterium indoltheticum]|uniref:hypothetical protein n=1 Tax=Chryseobacterium indoltheticum TaxID=254 RepID=UPI0013566328|nr:hypothetical protein [Chryseobacterium indoltheticum]
MKAGNSYKKKVGALEKWMGWRVLVGRFIGIGNTYIKNTSESFRGKCILSF